MSGIFERRNLDSKIGVSTLILGRKKGVVLNAISVLDLNCEAVVMQWFLLTGESGGLDMSSSHDCMTAGMMKSHRDLI